ncbi:MAG: hypothetical protein U0354_14165 [Candidatus Sericytochromatia bacterium]
MTKFFLDTKRQFFVIKNFINMNSFNSIEEINNNIKCNDIVFIHIGDIKAYTYKLGISIKTLFESILKKACNLLVYSGGSQDILLKYQNDFNKYTNFFVITEPIPYDENECPEFFIKFLQTLDISYLQTFYPELTLSISILSQMYIDKDKYTTLTQSKTWLDTLDINDNSKDKFLNKIKKELEKLNSLQTYTKIQQLIEYILVNNELTNEISELIKEINEDISKINFE